MENTKPQSKAAIWTGRIISILCILFLLFDSVMKIVKSTLSMQGSTQLGWPQDDVQGIGIILLVFTILYIIPKTAILGAILITGYLGGAISIMMRAEMPGHPFFFPLIFGILVWAGLYLREEKLRILIPLKK